MKIRSVFSIGALCAFCSMASANPVFGPFNGDCKGGGPGHVEWFDGHPPTEPDAVWTIAAWVNPAAEITAPTIVAGFGDGTDYKGGQRYLCVDEQGRFFWYGGSYERKKELDQSANRIVSSVKAKPGTWQHVTATFGAKGKNIQLYVDGKLAGEGEVRLTRASMQPQIAPPPAWKEGACFAGKVARFAIYDRVLAEAEIAELASHDNALDALVFAPAPSGPTPENRSDIGEFANGSRNPGKQATDSLPQPVPPVTLERTPKLNPRPVARPQDDGSLVLNRGWELADAAMVSAAPEKIASAGFDTRDWYDATVPGTALTTLVQQGVYPEPAHGLNNMLIPDLAMKSWWYRVEFPSSEAWKQRNVELLFKGVNYHAKIWLNGHLLGDMTGAFIRGRFNVTPHILAKGTNVLAVRVWPQPHYSPGMGEASVQFGTGANGGDGTLDGPAFFCTEGWDWLPTIRDRCTGIWQDVMVKPIGAVAIDDPQVITTLPNLPDLSVAEVTLKADLRNLSDQPQAMTIEAKLGDTKISRKITLPPHATETATFSPKEFPALVLENPKLWWPNGYGDPVLHELTFRVIDEKGVESSRISKRVGLREMGYEAKTPFVIKVNGRRILIRGGNWGLDEMLKRSSTEFLEPSFRLTQEAGLNLIRNWVGQNTQDNFYELADKYGLLVWNDFWLSTGGHNMPAINAELFMANADDVIKRYRSHASIALWCGRNEGTPPSWLNNPLAKSCQELDGTRFYIPNSRGGMLTGSGPWTYRDDKWYYKSGPNGFSTEIGINSIPTLDAIRAMLDPSQYWPWNNNDAWAYHDFPLKGHGDIRPFLGAARTRYGDGDNLEDFVQILQMQNYTQHRVIYESFNYRMWNNCTGRILWMSHPAWPSMVWQIYTSDYDTHAAYYGVKKACEMVHVQWNVVDDSVSVANAGYTEFPEASLKVEVYGLDSKLIHSDTKNITVPPSASTEAAKVTWADFAAQSVQFLRLELRDKSGTLLSENFYWHSDKPAKLRGLTTLPSVALDGSLRFSEDGDEVVATVALSNPAKDVALMTHLVLRNLDDGSRILPAFASDNYLSLLPGEQKTITIRCYKKDAAKNMGITLDGWNIARLTLDSNGIRPTPGVEVRSGEITPK